MNKVLFLVGPHACGKNYSSTKYVEKRDDVEMIDTGPIMRKLHKDNAPEISMGDWIKKIEFEYGKDITSKLILNEIEKVIINSNCNNFIIIGFRSIEGIFYVIEHLNLTDYGILYIDAPDELLYENFLKREKKEISFREFKDYLVEEFNSGLRKIKDEALLEDALVDYYYRNSNSDIFECKIDNYFTNKKVKKLRRK